MSDHGDAIRSELDAAGVSYRIVNGGKHRLVEYEANGVTRKFPIDITASDWRAARNARAEIRRELRDIGALTPNDHEALPLRVERPEVFLKDGVPHCDSRDLAEKFNKNHKDVLRSYDQLIEDMDPEFSRRNFALSDYVSDRGKTYRCIQMTRDGFTILAMSFTGKEAAKWKVKYLDAFNEMERQLRLASNVADHLESRVAHLEGEMRAATELLLEAGASRSVVTTVRRGPFIRASKLRALRRRGRAA